LSAIALTPKLYVVALLVGAEVLLEGGEVPLEADSPEPPPPPPQEIIKNNSDNEQRFLIICIFYLAYLIVDSALLKN
jgi:hypothetical protein